MSTELTGATPAGFGNGPQPAETPGFETRHNIERIAWIVLFVAFAVFIVLLIAAPLTVNYTLQTATAAQTATIDPTGTILLTPPGATEAIALTDLRKDVIEGSVVDAVENGTQATIRLISEGSGDEALASIQLYSGARLALATMRSPMFEASDQPYQARLKLERGQARIFTDSGQKRPVRVLLETPHGEVALDTGSYQVAVIPEQTDITVSAGAATLMKPDKPALVVDAGLRAWITADSIADAAVSATQNLLRNGNFTEPMRDTWESYVLAQNVTPGKVNIMDRDGRRVAYFVRQGEDNVPTEVGIRQQVNKDINVYDKVFLQLDVKLLFQSLPGAGYLSSEYPLRVEVAYTDVYGKQLTWGHGFYFRDPENPNWQIVGGQKIQPFNWFTYRSPNLMEVLKDTRPARIDSIRVYASGWNYQSMVSEVYLEAE